VTHLVIPNVDEALTLRLREQAARHGRSMEAEALRIIERALSRQPSTIAKKKLGAAMQELFAPLGGVEFPDLRDRTARPHKPISFDE
jgi:antitoxin FitA